MSTQTPADLAKPDEARRHQLFVMGLASLSETAAEVFSHLTATYSTPAGETENGKAKPGTAKATFNQAPIAEAMKRARQIEANIARGFAQAKIEQGSEEAAFLASILRKMQARSLNPKADLPGHMEIALAGLAALTQEAARRIKLFEAGGNVGQIVKVEEPPPPPPPEPEKPKGSDSFHQEDGIDENF